MISTVYGCIWLICLVNLFWYRRCLCAATSIPAIQNFTTSSSFHGRKHYEQTLQMVHFRLYIKVANWKITRWNDGTTLSHQRWKLYIDDGKEAPSGHRSSCSATIIMEERGIRCNKWPNNITEQGKWHGLRTSKKESNSHIQTYERSNMLRAYESQRGMPI